MQVFIKCVKKPWGRENVKIGTYPHSNKTIQIDNITVSHNNEDYAFLLEQTLELTEEQIDQLKDKEKLYEEGSVAYNVVEPMNKVIQQVLGYIKYYSFIPELDENLVAQGITQWSLDKEIWNDIPMRYPHKWVGTNPIYTLHESFIDWIPEFIRTDTIPFFAYIHLHKAFSKTDTRDQWINATIAAELAFKEFLGVFKPEVMPLLVNLASPPLPKMYKNILKEYTGEESPVYKSLSNGAEIRNALVHKPKMSPPSRRETEKYLLEVNLAIMHLQCLCYPKTDAMKFLYEKAKHEVDNFKF